MLPRPVVLLSSCAIATVAESRRRLEYLSVETADALVAPLGGVKIDRIALARRPK